MFHRTANIAIRFATENDVPAICAFDHIASMDEKRRRLVAEAVQSKHCSIAVIAHEIVGYVVLEYSFFECGFVSMLYVHADCRRRGVGTRLMQHAEALCTAPKLFTSTNQSNQVMQDLLQKMGYCPSGIVENLDERDPELIFFKGRLPKVN